MATNDVAVIPRSLLSKPHNINPPIFPLRSNIALASHPSRITVIPAGRPAASQRVEILHSAERARRTKAEAGGSHDEIGKTDC
jgi:hypothetical protein